MSARNEDPRTPVTLTLDDLRELTRDTVEHTLSSLGVDVKNPLQMQQDFARLREWRTTMDTVRHKGVLAVLAILGSALVAALIIGVKSELTRLFHP